MALDLGNASWLLETGSEFFDSAYLEGLRAFESGDYGVAIEAFTRCFDSAEDPRLARLSKSYITASYASLGEESLRDEQYVTAEAAYARAIELAPTYPDYRLGHARALWGLGETESHLRAVLQALTLNPEYVDAILAQAAYLCTAGELDSGIDRFEDACRRDPELYAGPYRQVCRRLKEGDSHAVAREIRAIHSPTSAQANRLIKLARTHERGRHLRLAVDAYRQAILLAPNYADVRCKLGLLLIRLKQMGEAIAQLKRAVELNPLYVEALTHLGTAMLQTGHDWEGTEFIARALQIDPIYPPARLQAALAHSRRSLR